MLEALTLIRFLLLSSHLLSTEHNLLSRWHHHHLKFASWIPTSQETTMADCPLCDQSTIMHVSVISVSAFVALIFVVFRLWARMIKKVRVELNDYLCIGGLVHTPIPSDSYSKITWHQIFALTSTVFSVCCMYISLHSMHYAPDNLFSLCLLGLFLDECCGRFRDCRHSLQGPWCSYTLRSLELSETPCRLCLSANFSGSPPWPSFVPPSSSCTFGYSTQDHFASLAMHFSPSIWFTSQQQCWHAVWYADLSLATGISPSTGHVETRSPWIFSLESLIFWWTSQPSHYQCPIYGGFRCRPEERSL